MMELLVGLSIWEDTFHHPNTIPNHLEPDHQLTPVFDKTLLDCDTFLLPADEVGGNVCGSRNDVLMSTLSQNHLYPSVSRL